MKDDQKNIGAAEDRAEVKDGSSRRLPWETPRVVWSGEIQTLAYQCSSGPAPVSGSQTEGCPP
ncbi:MAG: hypothetical protein GXP54_09325 [Deltaproteobacteria bacterium]|nr:hypothetical protein [Deltaproteobacteria bacterium]